MHRQDIPFSAKDMDLREDVHALGALVGEILREQGGDTLFEHVEGDRVAAIRRREGEAEAVVELTIRVQDRPPQLARDLVRAFSTWFQAVNVAEKVHRIRRRREYLARQGAAQPGGVEEALLKLRESGLNLEQVLGLLRELRIEPVFMAHPTESTRRTLLRKHQHIARLLLDRLNPTLTPQEGRGLWNQVRNELTTGWQTEEHPRQRLTVADEREHVLFYLVEILYRIVPAFYEEIEGALERVFNAPADSVEVPLILSFGSWVGGDMDGNPDVHAKTLRETLARQQQLIVSTYFSECQKLSHLLSQSGSRVAVDAALQKRIDEYTAILPAAQLATPSRHDRMPYRVFFGQVAQRLRNTWDDAPNHYDNAAQLIADVELAARSLKNNKGGNAGYHAVQRFLRRVRTFGFYLASIDLRQHADLHRDVLVQGLGLESAQELTLARLRTALEQDQGPVGGFDAVGRRTLAVFETIVQCRNKYGRAAIGRYIVSGARDARDMLGVLLLARWAGIAERGTDEVPLDVAPLFDSTAALNGAGDIMRRLYAESAYRRHLQARADEQMVLVGYSESNKETGIVASRWTNQHAQEALTRAAEEAQIRFTVCVARGGSVSRGGGRIDRLVHSAPPGVLNRRLRVTEQGETVNQNYGLRPIAMRTLERAFGALSMRAAQSLQGKQTSEDPRFHAVMQRMAEGSAASYRALVRGSSAEDAATFFRYFRQVTPIDVIERMQVGSRPASYANGEGLDSLRPVPWGFAWTQSRLQLPGWYGAGSGLKAALEAGLPLLKQMYSGWFFFTVLIDDIERMLARTDLTIARFYDSLADVGLSQRFFPAFEAEFELTTRLLLEVKGLTGLLDADPALQRSIRLRNPYVDPMNLMQVDLLKRWRQGGRQDEDLFAALLDSISGIAQGLQSTG